LKVVTEFVDAETGVVTLVDRDELLPFVELSLNCRINSTLKTSPFELFFGRPFAGFSDIRNSVVENVTYGELRNKWRTIYNSMYPLIDAVGLIRET